ncbi:MAG: hypothetical protein IPK18_07115 [Sphingobacteriales bacterium]|jgi:antitoxin component YwqK of YwqJK toxin-antitoxin module|nr:MAG: hypothetical protein IPK18_07115 [Sphingobacteriales bacterium]
MKSNVYVYFFVLVVLVFTSCKTKIVTEKDINGNILKKYSVLKKAMQIKHGKYEAFYDNGKLLETSTYVNGKLDGKRTLFFENGQIMIVENYHEDIMDGLYESFFENSGKKQTGQYKDNKVVGVWKNYFEEPKNQVKESFTTTEGRIDGNYKEYARNGKIIIDGNKIEILDGLDVFDGAIKNYDSITGKHLYTFIFEQGKMIRKDSIQ